VLSLFAVTLFLMGATLPDTPAWLLWLSLFGPAYYIGLSAYLSFARSNGPS
jgi:hypothetical protein